MLLHFSLQQKTAVEEGLCHVLARVVFWNFYQTDEGRILGTGSAVWRIPVTHLLKAPV